MILLRISDRNVTSQASNLGHIASHSSRLALWCIRRRSSDIKQRENGFSDCSALLSIVVCAFGHYGASVTMAVM